MANRRMFSKTIVKSEEFSVMPKSSQALYFHLGMEADDDGFVHPGQIMRSGGYQVDDLKILLAKRFLLTFESGVVVIKHWLIHNLIQKDRHTKTRYEEELKKLFIKDNKAYTDNLPIRIAHVNKVLPQVRLGKVKDVFLTDVQKTSLNQEDLTIESVDEDGNVLKPRWGSKGTTDKKLPPQVKSLWGKWVVICNKETGVAPSGGVKEYLIIKGALSKLPEEKILDLFEEWFLLGKPDHEAVQITRALSNYQINGYLARNK